MRWTMTGILIAAISALAGTDYRKQPPSTAPARAAPASPASPATAVAWRPSAGSVGAKAIDREHLSKVKTDIGEGLAFLIKGRNADGGWGFEPGRSHPALTAMAIKALLQHPDYNNDSPVVAEAVRCLMSFGQADGGFYVRGEGNANYITSIAVMAMATAKDPRYRQTLADAVAFLRSQQILPGSKDPSGRVITADHPFAGGVSYGKHGRPDLSNVGFWMDAMHEAGVPGDDPAMQRALAFVKRLQNRTEGTEGQAFVVHGLDDGGFVYAVRQQDGKFQGESKAGGGRRGLRSYGSMTYTGFKSMLYADVARDDPRVRAAYDWIRKYWRLDSNPNMPDIQSQQGLYYYYHVFAKALRAWGEDIIPDARGIEHNWRHELIDALSARQKSDGSWINAAAGRWMEANPTLVTCYAVLALQETLN